MTKPKKMSAAEARRRTAARLEAAKAPTPHLPEPLEQTLAQFQPRTVTPAEWVAIEPLLVELMRRGGVRGAASFKQHLSMVTMYLAFLLREGRAMTIADTMQHAHIERWCNTVLECQVEDTTSGTRRARLKALASATNPGETAPPRGRPIAKKAIKPPYNTQEVGAIVRVARTQPSPRISQQLCAMVGLGLGADLDSTDLRHVRTTDVDDRGADGLWVTVKGDRPRTIAVRDAYAYLVREGLTGLRAGALLLGRDAARQNVTATIVSNAVALGSPPHIEQTRLRSTWLTHLMCAPVPLAVILTASGLISARSLVELLPHATAHLAEVTSSQEAQA